MVDDLKHRLCQKGLRTSVKAVHHSTQKQARIFSLEPYITQGILRFDSKHQTLLQQLTQYPMAKNDDGPDALEMAVETAHTVRRVGALGCNSDYNRKFRYI